MIDKPSYKVPTMAEIAAIPKSGLKAISTFSGAGGSCLGMKMAGFEILWANEFVDAARETYVANFGGTTVDPRDIRKVKPFEILASIGMEKGELDFMDGSPPCASFSLAGKREKNWGKVKKYSDVKQRVDDLFFEYARLLKGIQPKAFVAENVRGLVVGTAKGYFKEIFRELENCGYRVEARVLDAKWLGVPQSRQRLFFAGVRKDLNAAPRFPKPFGYYYTVLDAIGDLIDGGYLLEHGRSFEFLAKGSDREEEIASKIDDITNRPSNSITLQNSIAISTSKKSNSSETVRATPLTKGVGYIKEFKIRGVGNGHRMTGKRVAVDESSPSVMADRIGGVARHQLQVASGEGDISKYAIAEEAKGLKRGNKSGKYLNLVRASESEPSPIVTQLGGNLGAAAVVHPSGTRKFTIAELKRICSFPDDFVLTGNYRQQWERLGRAVPPPMMKALAGEMRDVLLGR